MKVLVLLIGSICVLAVNAAPHRGKQITFSTATTIDFEKIKFNENEPEVGSTQYYESHKWIAVSSDGFEYEGSIEEVMAYLDPAASEDAGEKDPSVPGMNDPADPHIAEDDAPGSDPIFSDLAKTLEQHREVAEKRSVIGIDTRQKVSPPNRFPYTAIGRIDIGCTGTFIARRTVLTAAHCVHQGNGGRWYEKLNVRRNKDCNPNNGFEHIWKWAVTFTGWTQNTLRRYDIAVITVRQASPVQMVYKSATNIPLETINIAGYPGDKPGRCLWRSSCKLSAVTNYELRYPCDTAGGMSGSGVYKYWFGSNTRIIYAVHVRGGSVNNKATRITAFYEQRIQQWISTYGGN